MAVLLCPSTGFVADGGPCFTFMNMIASVIQNRPFVLLCDLVVNE